MPDYRPDPTLGNLRPSEIGIVDLASPFPGQRLGEILVGRGALRPDRLDRALWLQQSVGQAAGPLGRILLDEHLATRDAVDAGLALQRGVWQAPVSADGLEIEIIHPFGADRCLRHRLLPWRSRNGTVIVATARPASFEALRPDLEKAYGRVTMAIADEAAIIDTLVASCGEALVARAEARPERAHSVRGFSRLGLFSALLGVGLCLALTASVAPVILLNCLLGLAALALLSMSLLKLAALFACRRPPKVQIAIPPDIALRLPRISLLVPLLDEAAISGALVKRLRALEYPSDRLDVTLIVEASDTGTPGSLTRATLPPNWRIVTVPRGTVRTKPRALNYGLDFAEGDIIGVYDAENAPEPDQLRRIVAQFAVAAPDTVCLQGRLDFYNPRQNWLARCFTIDYAAWFRIVLPGIARLGLAVPLGGTTPFFRRAALEELGRWDAHNVTEDADLGIRLARAGYRTEMADTTTFEEANCRAMPWIRQRARWLKGYALTWAVHMRHPLRLWRDLGPRKFLGFQILFLGTTLLFLLAPLMWSLLALPLGLAHPATALPTGVLTGIVALFIGAEFINLVVNLRAVQTAKDRWLTGWTLTMPLYFPLAAIASYRALFGIALAPTQWEKTPHGLSLEAVRPPRPGIPRSDAGGSRKHG
ncbi:glycosyltransferase family 2 protein [Ovoidimarina sediminis]|uniref:glycosyltransferase family 2 protein n=1 Tax=Ovoidimarina sediminis TaxID=3079856 RepID=UPI00290B946E|nr:glycosyltransferase family 2 protein [Rhodophyticola sp. MJ-SS7]MDU8943844.1 glycosyltransferase [Rhodophyticola sp. MJ-SS7]